MQRMRLDVAELPERPDAAAQAFYADWLPRCAEFLGGDAGALLVVLPAAGPEHDAWRRAAAGDLARAHAPKRVNMIAGGTTESAKAISAYLAGAPGVTGQYLPLA